MISRLFYDHIGQADIDHPTRLGSARKHSSRRGQLEALPSAKLLCSSFLGAAIIHSLARVIPAPDRATFSSTCDTTTKGRLTQAARWVDDKSEAAISSSLTRICLRIFGSPISNSSISRRLSRRRRRRLRSSRLSRRFFSCCCFVVLPALMLAPEAVVACWRRRCRCAATVFASPAAAAAASAGAAAVAAAAVWCERASEREMHHSRRMCVRASRKGNSSKVCMRLAGGGKLSGTLSRHCYYPPQALSVWPLVRLALAAPIYLRHGTLLD